jgi:hypothetical protein
MPKCYYHLSAVGQARCERLQKKLQRPFRMSTASDRDLPTHDSIPKQRVAASRLYASLKLNTVHYQDYHSRTATIAGPR